METQGYSPAEDDLVYDWAEKWLDFIDLINNVTGTHEGLESPPPPTVFDELQYQSLRSWLVNHEEQFVPLWAAFCQSRDVVSDNSDIAKDADFPRKYLQNPFLFFYEPENLYGFAQQTELQCGTFIWEPSEYVASQMRPLLLWLEQLMIEFIDWMDARVSKVT